MAASFNFDGTGDYLDYGDLTMFDGLSAATFSFWVNTTNFGGEGGYMGKYSSFDNGQSPFYCYDSNSTTIQMAVFGTTNNHAFINFSHSMSTGIWYHIAWSWAASRSATDKGFELYLNGIKQTLSGGSTLGTVSTLVAGNASCLIGALRSDFFYKNGKIAYVRCFNRALSGAEMFELYKCINHISNGLIFQADLIDSAGKEIYSQTNPTIGGNAAPDSSGPPVFFPTLYS